MTVTVRIPLLSQFIDANTATGRFVVERDRYVDGGATGKRPSGAPGPWVARQNGFRLSPEH